MNRRGFTLVEITAVLAILALIATVVLPRYVALRAGQDSRDFASFVMRLGSDGRLMAIETGQTVQVTYDDQRRSIVFQTLDPETSATTEQRVEELPDTIELTSFVVNGAFVSPSDWMLQFYPDGTGYDAGIEVDDEGYVYHVTINGLDGGAVRTPGALEQGNQTEWEAGELEQRV